MALPFEAKDLSPELSNYVHAYISAWLKEDSWPKDEGNKAKLKAIHAAWPFYLSRGFFETEEFYGAFLERNGLEQFPAFLRLMDKLQEPKKCIFQTDDDPRCVPFPPAFQAAFFGLMKSAIMSGDGEGLQRCLSSLEVMKALGMSRLHQSERQGDYHIMPIEQWLYFLKSIPKKEKESWNNDLIEAEGMELIKTWLDINRDWYGHTTKSSWAFSPKTEEERHSELTSNDWYYTFRNGFSKESWIRCLEITGAEHLCSLLHLGYVQSPEKFHYSLGGGDPDDVFLQTDFEESIESFLFSPKRARHDANEQVSFIGQALTYLDALGIRKFNDGFDVSDWSSALSDRKSVSDTEADVKPNLQNGEAKKSQPASMMSSLRMFFKEGWIALKNGDSSYLQRMMDIDDAHRNTVENHAPAPSGPVQSPGLWLFILILVMAGQAIGFGLGLQINQTARNYFGLINVGFLTLFCGPLLWDMVSRYVRFCIFARWRKKNWGKKDVSKRTEEQKIRNAWGTWYRAMTGESFDCNTVEISQAIHQAEDLAYAWDWANPALVYYGDRKMFHEIYMGLSRARNLMLSKWQETVPVRLFPQTPPTPIEEEISLEDLIAESHGYCPH